MPTRPDILLRPTNEVPCGILTDAAIPRTNRTKKRDKAGDLVYVNTKNQGGMHVCIWEYGKLITRSEFLWRKGYEAADKPSKIAADLWETHQEEAGAVRRVDVLMLFSPCFNRIFRPSIFKMCGASQIFEEYS
jgi:hypothetical protein